MEIFLKSLFTFTFCTLFIMFCSQEKTPPYKNENKKRVVEPGLFEVAVGGKQPGFSGTANASTTDVLFGQFRVDGE